MNKRKKHEGRSKAYPGVDAETAIDFTDGDEGVVSREGAPHSIAVVNYSLISFNVLYESTCDEEYLHYPAEPDGHVWSGTFNAPFRWDSAPRRSIESATLSARPGSGRAVDRGVSVSIALEADGCLPVGKLKLLLQLDTNGG